MAVTDPVRRVSRCIRCAAPTSRPRPRPHAGPGSVRRTSSMDITRATDTPDPVYLLGRALDLITGPDGSAQVARTAGS